MTERVLITGGMGYLGGRVAQALVNAGYSVHCGTRRIGSPPPPWLPQMQLVSLDWSSQETLRKAVAEMDCVVHLAAMNEIDSAKDPIGALWMNGVASALLLEAAVAAKVRRFIYFSTAHIYGAPLQGAIDETTLPRPQHPYAITHKVAEDFVLAAHDQKRIKGVVLRLSNGFGAPMTPDVDRWTLLINDLCRQAVVAGKLTLHSAGTQLRDFITLEDVSRAVIHMLRLGATDLGDGLFNLGGDRSASIFSMTELVAARWKHLTGKELPIFRPEPSAGEPAPLAYSCQKIKATGFALTSNVIQEVDDTLRLCIASFNNDR